MDRMLYFVMNELTSGICYDISGANTSIQLKSSLVHRFDQINGEHSSSIRETTVAKAASVYCTIRQIANHARESIEEFNICMGDWKKT